jgi:oligosaccharide repeat unit polymerase
MRNSVAFIATMLALAVLAVGAAVSFISWDAGLLIMLFSLSMVCISRYYVLSPGFAGSLALIAPVIICVYILGAVDRESAVFATNISSTVQTIIIVGSIALVCGLCLGGLSTKSGTALGSCEFSADDFFFFAGVFALLLSAINYATGDIALLSGDIDSTRFSGQFGVLGHLWSLIHPVTQVSVIIALLMLYQRRIEARWVILGVCSVASLALTGARSLVAIPFIAFGLLYLEMRRPRIQAVLIIAVIGLLGLGALGQARSASPLRGSEATSGFRGWFDSVDASLQTGPRVLTVAIERLQDQTFGGQFLLGDLPYVRGTAVGSDRMVTLLLGRDPNVVGGLPPTIFGGFYLDFSWPGVVIGAVLVGLCLAVARRIMYRSPNMSTFVWFGYFAAYIAVSGYSYISFRPSWIVVLVMCMAGAILVGGSSGTNSDDFEVQRISRRGRASYL